MQPQKAKANHVYKSQVLPTAVNKCMCRAAALNSKFISSVMPHVLCHNADGAGDNALHLQSLDNNSRISRKDRADRTRGESESTGGEDMQRINLYLKYSVSSFRSISARVEWELKSTN